MRTRHAVLAGVAVGLMSFGTTLMASAQASAVVHAAAPRAANASVTATATSVGSAVGLVVGMLFVLGVAAVSFVLRTYVGSPRARRTVVVPEALVRTYVTAVPADMSLAGAGH